MNAGTIVSIFAVVVAAGAACADGMKPATPSASDQQLISSALSAAPASVTAHARIIAMGPDGKIRTLRNGTNGFTCAPDDPTSPGPDPMCMDVNAYSWFLALMAHRKPESGKVGFIYMLAGGSDASNVDPYATKPSNGHWITTPPHVMVVNAPGDYYASYPTSANPDTSAPYVMWPGTPYQHTMIPVK